MFGLSFFPGIHDDFGIHVWTIANYFSLLFCGRKWWRWCRNPFILVFFLTNHRIGFWAGLNALLDYFSFIYAYSWYVVSSLTNLTSYYICILSYITFICCISRLQIVYCILYYIYTYEYVQHTLCMYIYTHTYAHTYTYKHNILWKHIYIYIHTCLHVGLWKSIGLSWVSPWKWS